MSLDKSTSRYAEAQRLVGDQMARSMLLDGFEVSTTEKFRRGE
ncbi:MAG: hypothetical protein AAFP69_05330 [Planctomycetota bacterium]